MRVLEGRRVAAEWRTSKPHEDAAARTRSERGQASVELALVLPVLVLFLLGLVQTALVARDQVLLQDAARAAAREASVGAEPTGYATRRAAAWRASMSRCAARAASGEPVVVVRGTTITPTCRWSGGCSPTSTSGPAGDDASGSRR